MAINLNIAPYYDDHDEKKGFQKILFIPGRPIQTRELTQIQDILQTQIKRGGDFLFKNGSIVIPGNILYRDDVNYVKLEAEYDGLSADSFISDIVNKKVYTKNSDGTAIVAAQIIQVAKSELNDPPTLFLQYTKSGVIKDSSSGDTTYAKEFSAGDILYVENSPELSFKVSSLSDNKGKSSLAFISEGVFYVNGYYVQCLAQTVVVGKYHNTPTVKVGLIVDEIIVTENDDSSLYDGAHGFSNYGAPGAHRLKITLTLAKEQLLYGVDEVESDDNLKFIDLMHVKNGTVVYELHKTRLNELEKIIAERTYDESGDYIVKDFKQAIRENKTNNRGVWSSNTPYVEGDIVSYRFGADSEFVGTTVNLVATSSGYSGGIAPSALTGVHYDGGVYWVAGVSIGSSLKYNDGLTVVSDQANISEHVSESAKGVLEIGNGKAYVKGYQIDKNGTSFIKFNKARDVKYIEDAPVVATEGSFILVKNMNGIPDINTLQSVDIKDISNTTIGTLRVRSVAVEYAAEPRTETTYRLQVIGVVMKAGNLFSLSARSLQSGDFSAQIVAEETLLSFGSVYSDNSTTLYGKGTLFQSELDVGQQVKVNDIVYSVVSIESDIRATLNATIPTILPQNSVGCYIVSPKVYGNASLITRLPHEFVRSTRMRDDITVAHQYSVRRRFTKQNNSGIVTVSLQHPDEIFQSTDVKEYVCALNASPFSVVYPSSVSLSPDAKTATLSFTGGGTSTNLVSYSGDIEVVGTVQKKNSATREKQKIRKVKTIYFDSLNSVNAEKLSLGEADAFKLLSVKVSGGVTFTPATPSASVEYKSSGETDITEKFTLHTGQTQTEYGVSYITFSSKFDATPPSKPIKVTFEYFDHTAGDFFSVNSYLNTAYKDIPAFVDDSGVVYNLRDCLDFRPRVSDDGLSFDGVGGSIPEPLSAASLLSVDYSYYLPRHDIVYLTSSGEIKIAEGISSDNPTPPVAPSNAITLFDVILKPYTAIASNDYVIVKQRKNQRYTMRDIADIDSRVSNLEYYTSLSALEKKTNDMVIKDSLGYDRFKNGFVADDFSGHGVGELQNNDYLCAIDQDYRELRPSFVSQTVSLTESRTTNREANSYVVKGSVAMLPYEEVPVLQQRKGSIAMEVNPFMNYKFEGGVKLYPDNDFWINHTNLPSQSITVGDENAASIAVLAERANIVGTTYGQWGEYSRSLAGTSTAVRTGTTTSNSYAGLVNINGGLYDQFNNTTTTTTTTTTTNRYNVVDARTNTTTSANATVELAGSIDAVSSLDLTPYMRTRHIVAVIRGMKPNSQLECYINDQQVNGFVYTLNRFVLTGNVDKSKVYSYENGSIRTDNIDYRVWSGFVADDGTYIDAFGRRAMFNRSLWNTNTTPVGNNNTFDRGEALRFTATDYTNGGQTISGKLGVVVAIENEEIDGELKQVLYVANDLCNQEFFRFTNLNIVFLESGQSSSAEFIGRTEGFITNSLGNSFVVVEIPNRNGIHVKSGTADVKIVESGGDSVAQTKFTSNGTQYNKQMTNLYDSGLSFDARVWTDYRNRTVSTTSSTSRSSTVVATSYQAVQTYYNGGDGGGDGGGGGGGCFLTTSAVTHVGLGDNCDELNAARYLRDVVMKDSLLANAYFKSYRTFGYVLSKQNIDWESFYVNVIAPLTREIKNKNYSLAMVEYARESFVLLDSSCTSYKNKAEVAVIFNNTFSKFVKLPYFLKWAIVKCAVKLLRAGLYTYKAITHH